MASEINQFPSARALTGLRVLDFTGSMGGYCGLLLANLGAEVILIEPPNGNVTRRQGPFKDDLPHPEGSLSFVAFHTNKRGIVLDLDSGEGRRTFQDLACSADVFIHDNPAYFAHLGFGYHGLQALNPSLVVTSVSGFGISGPYADFKAPNIVAFAMGGLMNLCGHPGRPPLVGPCELAYRLGSVHAAFGTLVALFNRQRTGHGEHVEVSLQDVLVADPFLRLISRYSATGEIPQRTGNAQPTTVAETYKCKNGYARIFVNQADQWRRFIEWLGSPVELMDSALENVRKRFLLRPVIDRIVDARTADYDTQAFFEEFQSRRLAAAPINSPSEFLADKQTLHRAYVTEIQHAYLGRHKFAGDPYKLSETPWHIDRGAPTLGADQAMVETVFARPSAWLQELRQASSFTSNSSLPFAGIRVISFPTGIVGPALAGLLAEHGAEVIAIEAGRVLRSPQRGERWQVASDLEGNRGRKRVAINMKHPEGLLLAKKLIALSDVVAENYSARVMANWGLDYPRMKEIREDVILTSLQAFGQTGPRRDYVSFGPILMAFSGMTYLWRDPDMERPGVASQTAFPDYIAPSFGALAILAALHYRSRTGKGQYIDLSQAEAAASLLAPAYLEWFITGREPQPQGNFSLHAAPQGCYPCKGDDCWCVIAVGTQEEWVRFCELVGHREWIEDARFAELGARLAHRTELDALIATWTRQHTPHQVMLMLQRNGVPAGVVQNAEDLYRDPHLRERGASREIHHSPIGWVTRAGPSVRFASRRGAREEVAHSAGEDNEEVFGGLLGLSTAKIKEFIDNGVVQ